MIIIPPVESFGSVVVVTFVGKGSTVGVTVELSEIGVGGVIGVGLGVLPVWSPT